MKIDKIVLGLVLSFICFQVPVRAEAEFKSLKVLSAMAKNWNKVLPQMLDEDTQFTRVEAEEAKLIFVHKLVKLTGKTIPPKVFKEVVQPSVTKNVCNEQTLRITFLDKGVTLGYVYYDMDDILIATFNISPEDCKQGE